MQQLNLNDNWYMSKDSKTADQSRKSNPFILRFKKKWKRNDRRHYGDLPLVLSNTDAACMVISPDIRRSTDVR